MHPDPCVAAVGRRFPADNFGGVWDLWLVTKGGAHNVSTEDATISGPWMERLAEHLEAEAYSPSATRKRMAAGRQFLLYLEKQSVQVALAAAAHEQAFLAHKLDAYRKRYGNEPGDLNGWRWGYTAGIHMTMRLARGQWPPVTEPRNPQDVFRWDLCDAYAQWLSDVRGLAASTIRNRRVEARRFLESLDERGGEQTLLADITVADLDHYVTNRVPQLRRVSRQYIVLCLRGFLRYMHMQGLMRQDLSGTLVSPRRYAFESIPPALRAEHVEAVLKAAEKDRTPKGLRDHAILLLLSIYGLRAGEVTALRLDDIDWHKDCLRVRHSKTGYESFLPLLSHVGEAILTYLQRGRPQTKAREVFLRVRAPFHPLRAGSSLYHMVEHRLQRAKITLGRKHGSHAFRHARAVGLLEAGVTMKSIGDVLGHRCPESTAIYLKLATSELRAVGLDVPVGVS
jgi:site-specific recombinase XerD